MENKKLSLYFVIFVLLCIPVISNAGGLGIIVNKDLYPLIESSISTYIADVKSIEKMDVWLEATSYDENSSPDDLKSDIKSHYDSDYLEGVIFVGDLPIVKHEDDSKYHPCDWWWMDLDGVWGGSNYNFNSHTGNREMEIWHSRITASVHSDFGSEEEIVNNYFERVQKRMRGQDDHGSRLCVIGDKGSWGGLEREQSSLGYPSDQTSNYSGSSCTPANWQNEQESGELEFGYLYSHSGPTMHSTPSWSYSKQIGINADGRFFHLFACSNSLYTGKNMGGAYGLSGNGLIGFGSTKSGSVKPGGCSAFNTPLKEGKCFGEAFKNWASTEGIKDHDWNYGMTLQGVGTLKLSPYASGPFLTVSSPNGGEEWEQGNTYNIEWGSNVSGNVKIELLKDGKVDKEIESSVENNGLYSLEVTDKFKTGKKYKIRISSLENDTVLSESAEDFSIIGEFIITEIPYEEQFDDLEKGSSVLPRKWEQLTDDDLNWVVWEGKTPSKEEDQGAATGPDAGHTGSGKYLYVESSGGNSPDKKATNITPKINTKNVIKPELSFWYHMFSDNEGTDEMGDLYLDISVDGEWKNDAFSMSKNQKDEWHEAKIDLSKDYVGERVIFRFRAVTGTGWASDICIDDFIVRGEGTSIITNTKALAKSRLYSFNSRIYYNIPAINGNQKPYVSIKLYDLKGKLIRTLVNGNVSTGYHSVPLENYEKGSHYLAAGLYLCKIETQDFIKTINVVINK